jgi:polyisoprenoid-binding protein YceI
MCIKSVAPLPIARAQLSWWLLACLAALQILAMAATFADEPCRPFEDRINPKLLEVMRSAASEGRLYRAVPGYSRVGFSVQHFPLQEFRGEFTNIVGGLVMPSIAHRYGEALLLIQTNPLEASDEKLVPLLKSHEFMDTSRYPDILFIGRAFEWLAPLRGYIYGDLSLHGRTQPVVFNVSIDFLEGGLGNLPDRIVLQGKGQVSRYQFNMRSRRFTVSETVDLYLDVEMVPWGS